MFFTLEELDRTRKSKLKRHRVITFTSLGVVLLLLVFFGLYQFTDVILGLSTDLKSAPQSGDWAMFRRDMSRTGSFNPGGVLPRGDLKWTFATGGGIHSSPAVVDGTVYVGSRDGNLYALNADTGEKLWAFKTGSWVESSPVVVGGVVYVGSNDGYLYALDARTGAKLWSFGTKYSIRSSPAVADGIIYFGSNDYCVYAVDALTGKKLWRHETDSRVTTSPVVSDGIVVVGTGEGALYTLNARNGKLRLQFKKYSTAISDSLVNNSVAYFVGSNNLYAVDIQARNWPLENKLRTYWAMAYLSGLAPSPPKASGYLWDYPLGRGEKPASSPAMFEDKLYLGLGSNLVSLDVNTHIKVWSFATKEVISSSPAVTDKAVFVGSQDSRLYAVDRATGAKLWDIATGDSITSSPALADGVVYVGSLDGKLYAVK
jgi:outer membrane protein assembly factor BamB